MRSNDGPHYEGMSRLREAKLQIHDLNVHEVVQNIHNENKDYDEQVVQDDLNNIINRIEE